MESLPSILTIICISGLILPTITMYVAFINVGARFIYTIMYVKFGSNWRPLGSIAGNLPLYTLALGAFGMAIKNAVTDY